MFHQVKKLAKDVKKVQEPINPFSILATAKLIASSKGFNDRIKAFKQKYNKDQITPDEMLQVYKEYIVAEREDAN